MRRGALCWLVCWNLTCAAQQTSVERAAPSPEIDISDGVHVPSPDGSRELVAKGFGIVLMDKQTAVSRPVMTISQREDQVGWSPDGAHFFVDDREASNVEKAYLYDATTLSRFDLGGQIAMDVAQYPSRYARYLLGAGHTYYHAERWLDATHLDVTLSGHFDGFCRKWDKQGCCSKLYPTHSFLFHYTVQSNGDLKMLSASAGAPGSKGWKR